jgi:hypothetical protein
MKPALLSLLALGFGLGLASMALSQTDDVFAFIPDGGRTLLDDVLAGDLPAGDLAAFRTETRTSAEWLYYLGTAAASIPAIAELDEYQRQTLADYLFYNAPFGEEMTADTLPPDGRDLTLRYCQSCHIVTVVVTQSRAREAWLGTLNKPSHIEVDLTPEEREALADYLVVNGGIPIEEVPPELRAGGASY